jgi:hypothetical protein
MYHGGIEEGTSCNNPIDIHEKWYIKGADEATYLLNTRIFQ